MVVDSQSALRGVRSRLIGAVAAAATTLVCLLYAMLTSLNSFGSTFALTVAMCSFGAAVALLLSARHEEEVHELAAGFDDPRQPGGPEDVPDSYALETNVFDKNAPELKALPEPHPLEGDDLFERAELRGVKRRDYSAKTDGVI
jgi:hypothetical protein